MTENVDIVVVGAGMAGASVASLLAKHASVLVLEAEDRPGVHATGRSAALYAPGYGAGPVRVLTKASRSVLFGAREDATSPPLVRARASVIVATETQLEALDAMRRDGLDTFDRIDAAEVERMVPVFRPGLLKGALIDRASADIDVDAVHQMYLRALRAARGEVRTDAPVRDVVAENGGWRVLTPDGEVRCRIVVDAAGAWADQVAAVAGVAQLGLQPKRRTAALVDAPQCPNFADWPNVIDVDERFYFKPDAGRLLVSPAEETDVEPHDAYADDEALAEGIERIAALTTIEVIRAPRAWAGLRTFSPDRIPVIGFASRSPAPFFWLAGQGGYGIQTAPAIAELAAGLILGRPAPDFADRSLIAALSPARFGSGVGAS